MVIGVNNSWLHDNKTAPCVLIHRVLRSSCQSSQRYCSLERNQRLWKHDNKVRIKEVHSPLWHLNQKVACELWEGPIGSAQQRKRTGIETKLPKRRNRNEMHEQTTLGLGRSGWRNDERIYVMKKMLLYLLGSFSQKYRSKYLKRGLHKSFSPADTWRKSWTEEKRRKGLWVNLSRRMRYGAPKHIMS